MTQVLDELYNYKMTHVELWSLQKQVQEKSLDQHLAISNFFQQNPYQNNPVSLYRNNPVMMLPRSMPLGQVCAAVLKQKHTFYLKG